eukprot:m.203635 g.203635  ORF g.203635 m.203635 type:complete len:74 (-) comp10693_c0_seq7:1313-1534(-)
MRDDAGPIYEEMRQNLLDRLEANPGTTARRIQIAMPPASTSLNTMIGRAAHIALLDDEVFTSTFVATTLHLFA